MIGWDKVKYLSVHDASPKFQKELEIIFDKLNDVKIKNRTIAIVPNWGYKWDIRKYPKFVQLMKQKEKEGWELVLHGYSHSHPNHIPWYDLFFQSKESWEFYKLSYEETKNLALKGLKIFEEVFGHRPKGFIAPNWRLSDEGYKAIKYLGFEYTSSIRYIKWFKTRWEKCLAVWQDPTRLKLSKLLSFCLTKEKVRRIIHPRDRLNRIL